jgi:hypothetical protein
VALVWPTLVVCRFVGVVGGVLSPVGGGGFFPAATGSATANARPSASAAPAAQRGMSFFLFMCFLPERALAGARSVHP